MSIEQSVKAVEVVALNMDPPVVMQETASVKEVVRAMQEKRSGFALLCREGRLSGIFTERDVLNKVVGKKGVLDRAVSDLMTPDPVSVDENAPIRRAILRMHEGGFRNVPVLDTDGNVVSCVRHKDILHYLVDYFAQRVLNLPPDPDNMPDTLEGG
jgi:CBS domain-containing protein